MKNIGVDLLLLFTTTKYIWCIIGYSWKSLTIDSLIFQGMIT